MKAQREREKNETEKGRPYCQSTTKSILFQIQTLMVLSSLCYFTYVLDLEPKSQEKNKGKNKDKDKDKDNKDKDSKNKTKNINSKVKGKEMEMEIEKDQDTISEIEPKKEVFSENESKNESNKDIFSDQESKKDAEWVDNEKEKDKTKKLIEMDTLSEQKGKGAVRRLSSASTHTSQILQQIDRESSSIFEEKSSSKPPISLLDMPPGMKRMTSGNASIMKKHSIESADMKAPTKSARFVESTTHSAVSMMSLSSVDSQFKIKPPSGQFEKRDYSGETDPLKVSSKLQQRLTRIGTASKEHSQIIRKPSPKIT